MWVNEWVYVLKKSFAKSEFTAAGIQAAGEKLDILKMTPQQRAAYEREKQADMSQKILRIIAVQSIFPPKSSSIYH